MRRLLWIVAGILIGAIGIAIAGSSTVDVKDAAGNTKTFTVITDGSGNFVARTGICDQSAASSCATVAGNALTVTLTAGTQTIGALSANQSVNVNQLAGTTTDTNSGSKSAGTLRVVLATDQPQLTAALKVDGSAVTQPISGSVSISGTATISGAVTQSGTWTVQPGNTANTTPWLATVAQGGNSATVSAGGALKVDGSAATQPVSGTVAISGTVAATQSGTWTVQPGNTANTTPWLATVAQGGNSATVSAGGALKVDGSAATQPVSGTVTALTAGCSGQSEANTTTTAINLTGSGRIITGTSSQKVRICALNLVSATAQNIALVEGTGSTCGTGTAGMAGGTTAATGWNLAANGGLTYGNGLGAVFKTATNADDVCLLLSSSGQASGSITWVSF